MDFTKHEIILSKATPADLPALQRLYVETIRKTCSKDYDPEQIRVWTASIDNKERWLNAINDQHFLMAKTGNELAGFGSLKNGNYLDFLYVHPDYAGKGVAGKLFQALEAVWLQHSGDYLYSDVSITARPFFEKKGFRVEKEDVNLLKGVEIINYRMVKMKPRP